MILQWRLVWLDSLRPINNLSVKQGGVFLGCSKTTAHWRRWGLNLPLLGLESSTLPLSHHASNEGLCISMWPHILLNQITHCVLPEFLWYCNEGLCISLWRFVYFYVTSPKLSHKKFHPLWPTWRSVILQWRLVYFSVTFSRTFSWNAPLSDWNCAVSK